MGKAASSPAERGKGHLRATLAVLALAIAAFALTAAPASAAPPTPKMGDISNVSYGSATVAGSVVPSTGFGMWTFQYSTDGTNWVGAGGGYLPFGATEEIAVGPVDITGLKGGTKYFVRLTATNFQEEGITPTPYPDFTTLPVDPPTIVATDDASAVFSTSVTATGTVKRPANPNPAFDVTCRFEYVSNADFTATGYANATARNCQPSPIGPADADTNKAVTGQLGCTNPVVEQPEGKCLQPATTYRLRIVTENASPTVVTKEAASTFTTAAAVTGPTVVATNDATDVTYREAQVSGEIERPAGADPALNTSCNFEYVKQVDFNTTGFANAGKTPCVEAPPEAPLTASGPTPVSAELTFLRDATTYYLRLSAANGGDTASKQAANTFTTVTAIPMTFEIPPVPLNEIQYTSAHATGTIDPGKPERGFSFGWETSTDPNAPDDKWAGGGICCGGDGTNKAEYSTTFTALKPGTKYYVRFVAFDFTYDGDLLYSPAPYTSFTTKGTSATAIIDLDPVTTFTANTAHFSGTVDPNAPAGPLPDDAKAAYKTDWHFECVPECKNTNGNEIGGTVAAEEGAQTVVGDAVRLDPNEDYEVTLVATNVLGTVRSAIETFHSTHIKPTVKSAPGASDGKGGYTIQGTVNPNNSKVTDCHFEWGPTAPNYAYEASCSPMPAGRNEIQTFSTGVSDNFQLTYRGETTNVIPDGATPALVEAELKALARIGASGISKVTRGEGFFSFFYHVYFDGPLAEKNVEPLSVTEGIQSTSATEVTKGGNSLPIVVEAHLPDLTPGAVYHFKLVATNGAGTSQSGDGEFVPTKIAPESCANEQIRKENSSLALPECRAYETVTPPGKEGFKAALARISGDSSGDSIAYRSTAGNIAKSGQNSAFSNAYVAVRTTAGWETIPNLNGPAGTLKGPPSVVNSTNSGGTYSEDLLTSIWAVNRQDNVPGDNFYLRNQDGSFTLIGPNNGTTGKDAGESWAFSGDLKHVVRWAEPGLFGASIWGPGVYETVGTGWEGSPRRVDLDNSGSPISNCAGVANSSGKSVSRDGRVIVFRVTGGCGGSNPPADELWARVGGTTAVDVSATQCTRVAPACNGPVAPEFVGTSPDGSRVFFTTTQQLVNDDSDETSDIYACDIPAGTPSPAGIANPCSSFRLVSAGDPSGAAVESVDSFSENGASVVFVAKGVLAANKDALDEVASSGDQNLYLWRTDSAHPDGQTTFLGRLDSNDLTFGDRVAQTTPDGRYLVFSTATQLVDTDTDDTFDIYRYDVEAGALTRVSTNVVGVAGNGDGFEAKITNANAISDDGEKIAFESSEGLSPADGNAEPDVYLWTPERISLISTGSVGAGGSAPRVSGSGKNVFFQTAGALTPADGDDLPDVYNARIDGGFSFATKPPCVTEACLPPSSASPSTPTSPANQAGGEGNVTPRTCLKGKVLKGDKCVKKKKNKKPKKKKKKKANNKRGGSK